MVLLAALALVALIPTSAAGSASTGAEETVPKLTLSGESRQKLGNVVQVKVACSAGPCSVDAGGTLKIEPTGNGKVTQPKLKSVHKIQVPAARQVILNLTIPAEARKAAAEALAAGGKVSAKVSARGRNSFAGSPVAVFKVTLTK